MVRSYQLTRETTGRTDVIDLSDELRRNLGQSGVQEGLVVVFVPGSTGAVTTIEYEPGVLRDLRDAVARLLPESIPYAHDATWGDGNGYSHVRAAMLGPSLSIPIVAGEMTLGTWQQVVLVDFDNRPRKRRVIQQIIGPE